MVGHEDITTRLATREVEDVAREFADLVSVEQLTGLAFVSVATASGVAIAQQVVDLVVPRLPDDLGLKKDPQRARDFLVAGLLEGALAFVVGLVAVKFIGPGRSFLFATAIGLSIGAVAIAGANLIEFGQRVFGMATAQVSEGEFLEGAKDRLDDGMPGQAAGPGGASATDQAAAGGSQPVATDGGREVEVDDRHWQARAGAERGTAPAA
jgi:hypothetical protein